MPVSTSQRLVPEVLVPAPAAPLVLGLVVELLPAPVLLLSLLGLELELPVLGLLLGLELLLLPLGELEVWAIERLATPRNAAATAAQSTLVFIATPRRGLKNNCPPPASMRYA
jgi:hypothetical protein